MALSKRLLVLGHKHARLICEHELFLEEFIAGSSGCSQFRTNPYLSFIKRFEFSDRSWWFFYRDAVWNYTLRNLNFQEDIISAFEGVADVLQAGTATTFIFNLPDTEMDEALLWYPSPRGGNYEGELRRSSEKVEFPSWSWAGWRYCVLYVGSSQPCASAVAWLCRSRKYPSQTLWIKSQQYRCQYWRENGWVHSVLDEDTPGQEHIYTHPNIPNIQFPHPVAWESEQTDLGLIGKPAFLTFMAYTLKVPLLQHGIDCPIQLSVDESTRNTQIYRTVYDHEGFVAGEIILNGPFESIQPQEDKMGLIALSRAEVYRRHDLRHPREGMDLEADPLEWDAKHFQNISSPREATTHMPVPELDRDEDFDQTIWWDHGRFEKKFYPLYNVLLVEWRDFVACRIGLGMVHIDAFHAANPVWAPIRLG